jgi:hypothetical protein
MKATLINGDGEQFELGEPMLATKKLKRIRNAITCSSPIRRSRGRVTLDVLALDFAIALGNLKPADRATAERILPGICAKLEARPRAEAGEKA